MLEEALLGAIVTRACEASKIYQEGNSVQGVRGCLGRKVEIECHFATGGGSIMSEFEEFATKGGDGRFGLYGHCRS